MPPAGLTIQWYPGHIAKMERQLADLLKLVDVVIEVIDARLPYATVNPRLQAKYQNKPVLMVLNKADLAEPLETRRWMEHFKQQAALESEKRAQQEVRMQEVILYEANNGGIQKKLILDALIRLGEKKMKSLEAKGMKRRAIRVLVVGMPNVGKSSIINNIVAKKKTKTGHKAGVTRQPQWVRIHPALELLDSPGIIPPTLDSLGVGFLLAAVNSVGEASFEEESAAQFLLQHLEVHHPGLLRSYFKISDQLPVSLESIAISRNYVITGGKADTRRATSAMLSDFRQGRMPRLTLEPLAAVLAGTHLDHFTYEPIQSEEEA